MGSSKEFAIRYLKAVEKKNIAFFSVNQLNILECVGIKGTDLVSVRIINKRLPTTIVNEIETMFF